MTDKFSSARELAKTFERPIEEIIREAGVIECDITYLKNREEIRKLVDVVIDLDLAVNVRSVNVGILAKKGE